MKSKKILVIAPHADDEVLGCGGYLLHQSMEGAEIHLIFGTIGGHDMRQNTDVRMREATSVAKMIGAHFKVLFSHKDAMLDTIPSYDITSAIDKELDAFQPDEVFLCYKSRHQDHRKIYDCAMASFRLREGYIPKLIALYEYPFVQDGLDIIRGGKMYHDISDIIDDKVSLFEMYRSQIRKSPSPLNGEGIKKFAAFRGIEAGIDYAELFYVQKLII